MPQIDRRRLLTILAALSGVPALARAQGGARLDLGAPEPFSFDALIENARRTAAAPYAPPRIPSPEVLDRIDYDAHWRIRFRERLAPRVGERDMPLHFFHMGRFFREPVRIHLLEGVEAREIDYSEALFDMPADSPAHELGPGTGFSGFRVMRPGDEPDWISFLGAAYFRCDGPDRQYGLSARGIAIDTGLARPEQFPRFSEFWIGDGEREGEDVAIYARLDGPSVAGAYRIGAAHLGDRGQRCDVEARLFFREGVERLGVAPLTSMFWYSETNRPRGGDWRPEIHDSDGLALSTGAGERLWRPIRNPRRVTTSSFFDRDPRGFGLIQRDRTFDHYQDDGVFYDRRPSAWVEPKGGWGAGAVQLVEIPTEDETFDNVVAYWTPERQPAAGDALAFDYALHWVARDPRPEDLGRVTATYSGQGGIPGQPIPEGVVKYVIDFAGGGLAALGVEDDVELEVTAQGGEIIRPSARPVVGQDRWRAIFDLRGSFERPVELRAYLRRGNEALTETWTLLSERDPETGL